jgi:hypothetical protein
MHDFSELQRWMAQVLRRRSDLTRDAQLSELAARYFTGNARVSPVEQLEIYREQFWLRHTAALLEDFPGLSAILGQDAWQRLAEEYLTSVAPFTFSLRDLGRELGEFVARCEWLDDRALCADMARLEWAYVEVFDAADTSALRPERLAQIPETAWAAARILLNPALRLLRVQHPVIALRRRAMQNLALAEPCEPRAENLVLYRSSELRIQHEALDDVAMSLLEAFARGEPLLPACEAAARLDADAPALLERELFGWFASWAERGWFVDVVVDGRPTAHTTSKG